MSKAQAPLKAVPKTGPQSQEEIQQFLGDYFGRLQRALTLDKELQKQLSDIRTLFLQTRDQGGRVLLIGNGGSVGIASHLAIDLSKNAHVPAMCFTDAGMITCLANDYGYEEWLRHAIRIHGRKEDTLVAISSSGQSPNILNAIAEAKSINMPIVTLSGMEEANPLRNEGNINLWVDSKSYNIIETAHQFMLMAVVEMIIGKIEYSATEL